jgi:hypothetical protein
MSPLLLEPQGAVRSAREGRAPQCFVRLTGGPTLFPGEQLSWGEYLCLSKPDQFRADRIAHQFGSR